MKKKYITKLMIAACLSSALSLNSCIEEVFPESSTATIDQIGKSDQAISAMVNSVVAATDFQMLETRFCPTLGKRKTDRADVRCLFRYPV